MNDPSPAKGSRPPAAAGAPAPAGDHVATAPGSTPGAVAIAARNMTKRFPGVVANDRVSFEADFGEVHALLGENGAGKTTLCNLLVGLYRPDEGSLVVDHDEVRFHSPRDAQAAGIFMVHQHLRLVESMSVAENVALGRRTLRLSRRSVEKEVAEAAERFEMPVDPTAKVWQLSLGERQRVAILKALHRGARILILDEPTTVLTPQETDQLFASVREMTAAGRTVVFISHKLPEVLAIANRVTILRKGRSITTVPAAGTDAARLAGLMVGRDISISTTPRAVAEPTGKAGAVLALDRVSAQGDLGTEMLRDVSLEVSPGEILGIAGVAGNGQRELAEVVAGLRQPTAGLVTIGGKRLRTGDPRASADLGLAYVPQDRMGTGISPNLSISENLILKSYRGSALRSGPFLSTRRANANARALMERFDIRAPGPGTRISALSGGNIQKVLLARELSSDPRVLVAASPTRGLDIAATSYVRRVLAERAEQGMGILLLSEDLDEILELSDRVAVLYNGRVVGVVPAAGADRQAIGLMMAGAPA